MSPVMVEPHSSQRDIRSPAKLTWACTYCVAIMRRDASAPCSGNPKAGICLHERGPGTGRRHGEGVGGKVLFARQQQVEPTAGRIDRDVLLLRVRAWTRRRRATAGRDDETEGCQAKVRRWS